MGLEDLETWLLNFFIGLGLATSNNSELLQSLLIIIDTFLQNAHEHYESICSTLEL